MSMDLADFVIYANAARRLIPQGAVDWSDSPFAWMRHHGPRTKSKMGRDIVREWFNARHIAYREGDGDCHFIVEGQRLLVHLALQGKEGTLEFAQLRAPEMGIDRMMLLGIEPKRVRIWVCRPPDVTHLPTYKTTDAPGLHHCAFDPDEPPEWLTEVARWEPRVYQEVLL